MRYKKLIFVLLLLIFYSFKEFDLRFPEDFPEPYVPEHNELTDARIKLGEKLFFEKALSRDSTISCATCHNPSFAFTDRKTKAEGINGSFLDRNTPTLTNVAYNKMFLLDGVNPSLENQALVPFHENREFDLHVLIAADRLSNDSDYVNLAMLAYSTKPNPHVITSALASYQRTLISKNSKYDGYINKELDLTEEEIHGKKIFFDKLYCSECHSGFNFTNNHLANNGLYDIYEDSGRIRLTGNIDDRAIFKVPSLRNIGITYPYMHDGSMKSLKEVVYHYMSGGKNHENKSNIIKPFSLKEKEIDNLISFLHTLTDSTFINSFESSK
jgi:cytochrome c peroxidase